MKVVIAGASGIVGSEVLKKVLIDPFFESVTAVTRKKLSVQSEKLTEVIISDLIELRNHSNELKGDCYICCLGTTYKTAGSAEAFRKVDFTAIMDFGTLAREHNARSFSLVSSSGANAKSPLLYPRTKGETEAGLRSLNFKRLLIYRPGLLLSNRLERRSFEKIAVNSVRFLSPLIPSSWVQRISTEPSALAQKIVQDCKSAQEGCFIFESNEI